MQVDYINIGLGEQGIFDTLKAMRFVVKQSSRDFVVINGARKIISSSPSDRKAEAQAIYLFVRDSCRFTRDPHKTEFLQSPPFLLREIINTGHCFGDCDDITTLGCALMKSIGLPVGFRTISTDGQRLHHVYGLVHLPASSWTPWDASQKTNYFGDELPYKYKLDTLVI